MSRKKRKSVKVTTSADANARIFASRYAKEFGFAPGTIYFGAFVLGFQAGQNSKQRFRQTVKYIHADRLAAKEAKQ